MGEKGRKLRKLLKELSSVDQEIIDNGGQPRKGFGSQDKDHESSSNLGENSKSLQSPKL